MRPLLPSSLTHHGVGQLDDATPDAGGKHLPEEGDVLVGKTSLLATLQVPPHFIDTFTALPQWRHSVSFAIAKNLQARSIVNSLGFSPFFCQ